jgi:hypothetical protein
MVSIVQKHAPISAGKITSLLFCLVCASAISLAAQSRPTAVAVEELLFQLATASRFGLREIGIAQVAPPELAIFDKLSSESSIVEQLSATFHRATPAGRFWLSCLRRRQGVSGDFERGNTKIQITTWDQHGFEYLIPEKEATLIVLGNQRCELNLPKRKHGN